MKIKHVFLLALCLMALSLPTASFAAEKVYPIDEWFKNALAEKTSTADMCEVTAAGTKKWDAELNKQYKILMGRLGKKGQESLRQSQKAWVKFREAEAKASANIFYTANKGGAISRIESADRMYNFVRSRALELKNYNDVFKALK
ncbi:MAG: lysozyme inhibitor LprI family protein [Synergistaceae bacterium]|nr:lysozyme inhibitor LprI family protein [Synergistaceae bacterium]